MAISYVSESHSPGYGSSYISSVTINKPSGVVDGDLLLCLVGGNRPGGVPSGWTELYEGSQGSTGDAVYLYYKIASGEGSDYTFPLSSSAWSKACSIIAYRGVDPEGPIADSGGSNQSGSYTTAATPTVSTDGSQWLVHAATGYFYNSTTVRTWTSSGGSTERADFGGNNGDPGTASMAWYDSNGPVASGSPSRSHTSSASFNVGCAIIVAINPGGTEHERNVSDTVSLHDAEDSVLGNVRTLNFSSGGLLSGVVQRDMTTIPVSVIASHSVRIGYTP